MPWEAEFKQQSKLKNVRDESAQLKLYIKIRIEMYDKFLEEMKNVIQQVVVENAALS